jgi:hypothetical protein
MSSWSNLITPIVAATNHEHQAQPSPRCSRPAFLGGSCYAMQANAVPLSQSHLAGS